MSIVIDGSIYFDRLYRKYIKFRQEFKDASCTSLMNPVSMAIDYILYSLTHTEFLLKKYRFKVLYFNVNHRIGIVKRNTAKQRQYDNRLCRKFKDIIRIMEDCDLSGVYSKYHEYFKQNVKTYKLKELDDRTVGYDYDNVLPEMQLDFIRTALNEQNYLTGDDIYLCNLYVVSMLKQCRVVYTKTPNIDYFKYHKARFIRSPNWKHFKRVESIAEKPTINSSLFDHFASTRKLPLLECCQTNSYDIFILADSLYDLYIKGEQKLFPDEYILEDYIDVIDMIENRKESMETVSNAEQKEEESESESVTEDFMKSSFMNDEIIERDMFIGSIEPMEITATDIDIIIENVIKKWDKFFTEFDIKRLSFATYSKEISKKRNKK